MRKMNAILAFDEVNGILSAQAGCILEDMNNYVLERGYDMPYNIGSRGSCMLGGNLATNCGGSSAIRYKSLRSNTVGLEAVLADGTILRDMSTMRKDNSGYDLKQLMIGSEGTLGLITAAALKCPVRPGEKQLALIAVDSFPKCVEMLRRAKKHFRDSLSAFEVMDKNSQTITFRAFPEMPAKYPFDREHAFAVLIEVEALGEHDEHKSMAEEQLLTFFEQNSEIIEDGVIAQD